MEELDYIAISQHDPTISTNLCTVNKSTIETIQNKRVRSRRY